MTNYKQSKGIIVYFILLISVLSICGSYAYPQWNPQWEVYTTKYVFKKGRMNTGLRLQNGNLVDFLVDRNGHKWFALADGLQIEGGRTRIHDYREFFNREQIPGDMVDRLRYINCMRMDKDGAIWIGSMYGLFKYHQFKWSEIKPIPGEMPFNYITEITWDSNGHLWLCGSESKVKTFKKKTNQANSGIAKFDGEKWTCFTPSNSKIPPHKMKGLTFDAAGTAWMVPGKKMGVCSFDGKEWKSYNSQNTPLPTDFINTITYDPYKKKLWFGTGKGLVTFDGQKWEDLTDRFNISQINCMEVENETTMWVGTRTGGVYKISGDHWVQIISQTSPLPYNWVERIFIDGDTKWFAIKFIFDREDQYGGVVGLTLKAPAFPPEWHLVNTFNSPLDSSGINHMTADKEGNLVYSDKKSIRKFDGSSSDLIHQKKEGKNTFYAFAVSEKGGTWAVTKKDGLCKLNNSVFQPVLPEHKKLFTSKVSHMVLDKQNNLWVSSTKKGVFKYDGTTLQIFNKKSSQLPADAVYTVYVDSSGRVWAGTKKGLAMYDGTAWKVYDKKNSGLPGNSVKAVCEDKDGTFWIGTTKGAASLKDGKVTTYKEMKKVNVNRICTDLYGQVWIGTLYRGLVMYNGTDWAFYQQQEPGLLFSRVLNMTVSSGRDKLWILMSNPQYKYPDPEYAGELEEAEKKLAKYDENNLSSEDKKTVSRLKNRIERLKVLVEYENDVRNGMMNFNPPTAFLYIDLT